MQPVIHGGVHIPNLDERSPYFIVSSASGKNVVDEPWRVQIDDYVLISIPVIRLSNTTKTGKYILYWMSDVTPTNNHTSGY